MLHHFINRLSRYENRNFTLTRSFILAIILGAALPLFISNTAASEEKSQTEEALLKNEKWLGDFDGMVAREQNCRTAIDPLRPYVDQATLGGIETLLKARMSPFVELEAVNPLFEEVEVHFDVAFHDGIDDISFYQDGDILRSSKCFVNNLRADPDRMFFRKEIFQVGINFKEKNTHT